ncbi:hypothetical protein BECAL_02997 [Bellilinea caldifistulae]|uniref:hypothetical protein n=1 Tax=Bellilinea caldifistulae TaxID=360411 RepID=UPI001F221C52|nr:hypothetical protein [Bellilinea caldifistulae]GAP11803.1 hypothetical protein BECAL_02997 [Bellilinea caldifistulae]
MRTSSSIRQLQEQLGGELVIELVRDLPTAELQAAFLDENHPLAKDLRTAVIAAVDAGRNHARQIVVTALEKVLQERLDER